MRRLRSVLAALTGRRAKPLARLDRITHPIPSRPGQRSSRAIRRSATRPVGVSRYQRLSGLRQRIEQGIDDGVVIDLTHAEEEIETDVVP